MKLFYIKLCVNKNCANAKQYSLKQNCLYVKMDLALNNLRRLIYHKAKSYQTVHGSNRIIQLFEIQITNSTEKPSANAGVKNSQNNGI